MVILATFLVANISAQSLVIPIRRWTTQKWDANWIAPLETPTAGVYLFRKSFNLATKPESFIIHLSADNRYRLFVNGKQLNDGPQISDLRHWRFESLDITSLLTTGQNLIAIQVWSLGNAAPVYDMGKQVGLIVQGNGEVESVINTDRSWKCIENTSITPILFKPGDPNLYYNYYAAGPMDKVVVGMPWNWENPEFDDSKWLAVVVLQNGSPFMTSQYGDSQWELIPRSIPLMERTYQKFSAVRRCEGIVIKDTNSPITIPARQKISVN